MTNDSFPTSYPAFATIWFLNDIHLTGVRQTPRAVCGTFSMMAKDHIFVVTVSLNIYWPFVFLFCNPTVPFIHIFNWSHELVFGGLIFRILIESRYWFPIGCIVGQSFLPFSRLSLHYRIFISYNPLYQFSFPVPIAFSSSPCFCLLLQVCFYVFLQQCQG